MIRILVISFVIVYGILNTAYSKTIIVGHRGARGLLPESTLAGYALAIHQGVPVIDLDVIQTKDHEWVVYHDLALNPMITRDQHGEWIEKRIPIRSLTLRELKTYNVGGIKPGTPYHNLFKHQQALPHASVPTLQEVVVLAKTLNKNIRFQIEVKTSLDQDARSIDVLARQLLATLTKYHARSETRIQAFDWRVLHAIQQLDPLIETAYLSERKSKQNGSLPRLIKAQGGKAWDPESRTLNAKEFMIAKQLGLNVFVWLDTIDSDYDHQEAMRVLKMPVDGFITDRPDLAFKDLESLKYSLPAKT